MKAGQLLFEIDDRPYKASLDQALGDLATQRANSPEEPAGRRALHAARRAGCGQQAGARRRRPGDARQRGAGAGGRGGRRRTRGSTSTGRRSTRPIDGIAGIAPVQVGDLVTPSTVLTTVSQVDPMKVTFPITEREYLRFADQIKEHQEKGRGTGRAGPPAHPGRRQHVSAVRAGSTSPTVRSTGRRGRSSCRRSSRTPTASSARACTPRSARPRRPSAARSSCRSARCRRSRARTRSPSSDRTTRSRSAR